MRVENCKHKEKSNKEKLVTKYEHAKRVHEFWVTPKITQGGWKPIWEWGHWKVGHNVIPCVDPPRIFNVLMNPTSMTNQPTCETIPNWFPCELGPTANVYVELVVNSIPIMNPSIHSARKKKRGDDTRRENEITFGATTLSNITTSNVRMPCRFRWALPSAILWEACHLLAPLILLQLRKSPLTCSERSQFLVCCYKFLCERPG